MIAVGERFGAATFDVEDVFFGNRGEHCNFEVMIEELGMKNERMMWIADMVSGEDRERVDI